MVCKKHPEINAASSCSRTFHFGKHKGKCVHEVDDGYLLWVTGLSQDFVGENLMFEVVDCLNMRELRNEGLYFPRKKITKKELDKIKEREEHERNLDRIRASLNPCSTCVHACECDMDSALGAKDCGSCSSYQSDENVWDFGS